MPETTEGDPTQEPPETLLKEIERTAAECRQLFQTIAKSTRENLEALEILAARMDRMTRRMEVLRQTMRPAVPIVAPDDDRLCKGEQILLDAIKAVGECEDLKELEFRTGYAQSTLRTYLPMLRRKGIVQLDKLALV